MGAFLTLPCLALACCAVQYHLQYAPGRTVQYRTLIVQYYSSIMWGATKEGASSGGREGGGGADEVHYGLVRLRMGDTGFVDFSLSLARWGGGFGLLLSDNLLWSRFLGRRFPGTKWRRQPEGEGGDKGTRTCRVSCLVWWDSREGGGTTGQGGGGLRAINYSLFSIRGRGFSYVFRFWE